ncbi:hypothetical protein [Streptomyces sp. NPDC090022]|uniref:hypothetical protein n=1 Tax=Streptomyces sp. NPDC090022 TaxID=3365920 RepID=UPI003820B4F7
MHQVQAAAEAQDAGDFACASQSLGADGFGLGHRVTQSCLSQEMVQCSVALSMLKGSNQGLGVEPREQAGAGHRLREALPTHLSRWQPDQGDEVDHAALATAWWWLNVLTALEERFTHPARMTEQTGRARQELVGICVEVVRVDVVTRSSGLRDQALDGAPTQCPDECVTHSLEGRFRDRLTRVHCWHAGSHVPGEDCGP